MASKSKKTKRIRQWKDKPNKANLKAKTRRIQQNFEILRELEREDKS